VKLVASGIVTLVLLVVLEGAARLLGVGLDQGRSFGQFEEQVHVLLREDSSNATPTCSGSSSRVPASKRPSRQAA
jgi:hypothetical protein